MKKITRAFLFYFSLLTISIFIQSCCTQNFTITGSGQLKAYTIDYIEIDTVSGEFALINTAELKVSSLQNMSIISSSMATSCAENFINTIPVNQVSITCDQDFTFDGNIVSAGTDLSSIEELVIESTVYSGDVSVRFLNAFLDKSTFDQTDHTFKIKMKTDNDLELENEISVFMAL